MHFSEKKNRVNSLPVSEPVTVTIKDVEPPPKPAPIVPPKQLIETNSDENTPAWRKINLKATQADTPMKNISSTSELMVIQIIVIVLNCFNLL